MSGTTDSHPPVAERRPHVRELHGHRDGDDYAWMRDREDRAFHEYLAAERAYYDARMRPLAALARTLAAETASRFPTGPEDSVAWEREGFVYRTRVPEGADQAQLLRRGPDRP
ncbi:MAG: hypothetical protein ACRDL8_12905, partial [Solirubrobacteraceae bacterium]